MRYFFTFFIVLMVNIGYAQEVRISPDVARFYLEVYDKSKLLEEKDSLNQQIISNLKETISTKDLYIISLTTTNSTLKETIQVRDQEIDELKKEVKRQRLTSVGVGIGAILLIIAIL